MKKKTENVWVTWFGKFSSIIGILKAYLKLIFFMSNNEDGKVFLNFNRDETFFFYRQFNLL